MVHPKKQIRKGEQDGGGKKHVHMRRDPDLF